MRRSRRPRRNPKVKRLSKGLVFAKMGDELLTGEKSLTTRKGKYKSLLSGEQGVQRGLGLKKLVKGSPEDVDVYIRSLGPHSFADAMLHFGGFAGYAKAEGFPEVMQQDFPSGNTVPTAGDLKWLLGFWGDPSKYKWLKAWVMGGPNDTVYLYEVGLQQLSGTSPALPERFERAKGEWQGLGGCVDPDIYILPMTPALLKKYLRTALLDLADRPEIHAVVASAGEPKEALKDLSGRWKEGASGKAWTPMLRAIGPIGLASTQGLPSDLLRLSLSAYHAKHGSWAKLRGKPVSAKKDRKGTDPISFGVYSKYLGSPHSDTGLKSAFGNNNDTRGARSLVMLDDQWTRSLTGRGTVFPTYFRTSVKRAGKPVVIVLSGTAKAAFGMSLLPTEGGRSEALDMVGIADAMLWGNPNKPSYNVCFLLPPDVLVKEGRDVKEVTQNYLYQKNLWGTGGKRRRSFSSPFDEAGFVGFYIPALAKRHKDLRQQGSASGKRLGALLGKETTTKAGLTGWFPEFAMEQPAVSWRDYYGDLPSVQDWPAQYSQLVLKLMDEGLTRDEISLRISPKSELLPQLSLAAFQGKAEEDEVELGKHHAAFKVELGSLQQQVKPRKSKARPYYIDDLEAEEVGITTFMQNLQGGSPDFGAWVPVDVKIVTHKGGEKRIPMAEGDSLGMSLAQWEFLDKLRQQYLKQWNLKPDKVYPLVNARVKLINRKNAKLALRNEALKRGPDQAQLTLHTVDDLLKKGAVPIDGKPADEANWFLAVGSAKIILRLGLDGEVLSSMGCEWGGAKIGCFPYSAKNLIPTISRGLLRVGYTFDKFIPHLGFVFDPQTRNAPLSAPWETREVPYLFDVMPFYDAALKEEVLVRPPAEEPNPEYKQGYPTSVSRAFRFSGTPGEVKEGRAAILGGLVGEGKAYKKTQTAAAGRAPGRAQGMPKGFYSLAVKLLRGGGLRHLGGMGRRKLPEKLVPIQIAIETQWPLIMRQLNSRRRRAGKKVLPGATPPVILNSGDKAMEAEVLVILAGMLDQAQETYRGYFGELLRPSRTPVQEQGQVFTEEILSTIKAVENPRGRRGRKPRRPRRSGRSPRHNPLDAGDSERLEAWLETGIAPSTQLSSLSGPETNEEFIEAVSKVFPRGPVSGPKLRVKDTFGRLAPSDEAPGYDLIGRFAGADRDVDLEEGFSRGWGDQPFPLEEGRGESTAEEFRNYIAANAEMSVEEAKVLAEERLRSKKRGRIITPSGALCKMYRNKSKLKYVAPAPITTAGTAWIVVGPPVYEGGGTRIMTFRNGTHIDCDMEAAPGQSFGKLLGKAIESMVFWLAEKPIRMKRILSVNLSVISSQSYRTLWQPGWTLNVGKMIQRAYEGDAKTSGKLPDNLKSYSEAIARVASAKSPAAHFAAQAAAGDEYDAPPRTGMPRPGFPPSPVSLDDLDALVMPVSDGDDAGEG
jgi:hypothetical protein